MRAEQTVNEMAQVVLLRQARALAQRTGEPLVQAREVRFLEVGAGGILGIGKKRFLVPVEAVTEVAEDRVAIEPGRTEKVDGPAPFDTKVAPPPADDRSEDHASPPFDNAEDTAEHRGGYHSTFPVDRRPFL